MKGLVIKPPWIDLILSGQKTWEIRGSQAKLRERIALIKSKSGTVLGTCDVVDCLGPFTLEELRRQHERHRIPLESLDALPYPKTYAWVMSNSRLLARPVPYQHPSGAVIWVRLDPDNCAAYAELVSHWRSPA